MTFIAVSDRLVLSRTATEMTVWNATFRDGPGHQLYVFTMDDWNDGQDIYARVFAPGIGIAEDPATGGGAVALVGVLHGLAGIPDCRRRWTVHQGLEMGPRAGCYSMLSSRADPYPPSVSAGRRRR